MNRVLEQLSPKPTVMTHILIGFWRLEHSQIGACMAAAPTKLADVPPCKS